MYKVKQIAEMLDVETVFIHEVLINYRDELTANVIKKNSITYIDYDGYQRIKQIVKEIRQEDSNVPKLDDSVSNNYDAIISQEDLSNTQPEGLKKYYDDIDEIRNKISYLKQEISRLDIMSNREEEALIYYRKMLSDLL